MPFLSIRMKGEVHSRESPPQFLRFLLPMSRNDPAPTIVPILPLTSREGRQTGGSIRQRRHALCPTATHTGTISAASPRSVDEAEGTNRHESSTRSTISSRGDVNDSRHSTAEDDELVPIGANGTDDELSQIFSPSLGSFLSGGEALINTVAAETTPSSLHSYEVQQWLPSGLLHVTPMRRLWQLTPVQNSLGTHSLRATTTTTNTYRSPADSSSSISSSSVRRGRQGRMLSQSRQTPRQLRHQRWAERTRSALHSPPLLPSITLQVMHNGNQRSSNSGVEEFPASPFDATSVDAESRTGTPWFESFMSESLHDSALTSDGVVELFSVQGGSVSPVQEVSATPLSPTLLRRDSSCLQFDWLSIEQERVGGNSNSNSSSRSANEQWAPPSPLRFYTPTPPSLESLNRSGTPSYLNRVLPTNSNVVDLPSLPSARKSCDKQYFSTPLRLPVGCKGIVLRNKTDDTLPYVLRHHPVRLSDGSLSWQYPDALRGPPLAVYLDDEANQSSADGKDVNIPMSPKRKNECLPRFTMTTASSLSVPHNSSNRSNDSTLSFISPSFGWMEVEGKQQAHDFYQHLCFDPRPCKASAHSICPGEERDSKTSTEIIAFVQQKMSAGGLATTGTGLEMPVIVVGNGFYNASRRRHKEAKAEMHLRKSRKIYGEAVYQLQPPSSQWQCCFLQGQQVTVQSPPHFPHSRSCNNQPPEVLCVLNSGRHCSGNEDFGSCSPPLTPDAHGCSLAPMCYSPFYPSPDSCP